MWYDTHPTSLNDVPRSFLKHFNDISYRNDDMPHFEIIGNEWLESYSINLWIDYADVWKREDPESTCGRFCVVVGFDTQFDTDELPELIEYLESNIDLLRLESLIAIAQDQSDRIDGDEDYVNSDEFAYVLAWFKKEIFKFGVGIPPTVYTYSEDYMIAARELERAAVFNAATIVNDTPTPDNFNMFRGKVYELFGDNAPTVLELMAKHNTAAMVDFLWLDRN